MQEHFLFLLPIPFISVFKDFAQPHEEQGGVADHLFVQGDVHGIDQLGEVCDPVKGWNIFLQLSNRHFVVDGACVDAANFGNWNLGKKLVQLDFLIFVVNCLILSRTGVHFIKVKRHFWHLKHHFLALKTLLFWRLKFKTTLILAFKMPILSV